jgi:hypothetical protein
MEVERMESCTKTQYLRISQGGATVCRPREELERNPPKRLRLELPLSKSRKTTKGISEQMWRDYGLDFGWDERNEETFERVYYGGDLRSEVGILIEPADSQSVFVELWTRYFVDWEPEWRVGKGKRVMNPEGIYSKRYLKAVKRAETIVVEE